MGFIDSVLYEFKGQLSINDIYQMTYKELGYLRQHRHKINTDKQNMEREAMQKMSGRED